MSFPAKHEDDQLDSFGALAENVQTLVEVLRSAEHVVVYTGAGISTAASIPDYRGPDGLYTRTTKGQAVKPCDLTAATPTLSHMVLVALLKAGRIQHIVSQNCDGLHRRSGVEREQISEIHGNMYIEVCKQCEPALEYERDFDVTAKTARHRHATERVCAACAARLHDTIVLPGETGRLAWPLNWSAALDHAQRASHIVVLGSSLKVLRHYKALWAMERVKTKRPKIIIVNHQATSKDKQALFRIDSSCDDVMTVVARQLGLDVAVYERSWDPLFRCAAEALKVTAAPGEAVPVGSAVDTEPPPEASAGQGNGVLQCTVHKNPPLSGSPSSSAPSNWYVRGARKRSRPAKLFGKRRRVSRPGRSSPPLP